jgi:hypothetical protein
MAMGGSPLRWQCDVNWDECPSVIGLWWYVRVMWGRWATRQGKTGELGESVHARGDDGWRWVGLPYNATPFIIST